MANYKNTTDQGQCIFCAIAQGKIQPLGNAKFWENEKYMAWLSPQPNTTGFTVVIPKAHFPSDVLKMPEKELTKFVIAAKQVAGILEGYFSDVGRVGLIMEGTGINHAHIKLMPFHGTENLKKGEWQQILSGKEFWFEKYEGWMASADGPRADDSQLQKIAEDLKALQ